MQEGSAREAQLAHCAGLTALDVYMDSATVLTGAEDGSAFLSNIQSGRILGQLHGKLLPSVGSLACIMHVQQQAATWVDSSSCALRWLQSCDTGACLGSDVASPCCPPSMQVTPTLWSPSRCRQGCPTAQQELLMGSSSSGIMRRSPSAQHARTLRFGMCKQHALEHVGS